MAYEVYARSVVRYSGPAVSFTSNGVLTFNVHATRLLTKYNVTHVVLLHNLEEKKFAILAASPNTPNAFKIGHSKHGLHVCCKIFLDYYVPNYVGSTFTASYIVDDGLLFEISFA